MYSESERPWFVWIFVVVILICAASYGFWGWRVFDNGWQQEGGVVFIVTLLPTFVLLIFFIWACWGYAVLSDGFGLQFGFKGWSVRLDYAEIVEAKPVTIHWASWGGFGWRLRPDGIGYIVRSGPGIQIATRRKGRSYTFNCSDVERLLATLQNAGVEVQSPGATQPKAP